MIIIDDAIILYNIGFNDGFIYGVENISCIINDVECEIITDNANPNNIEDNVIISVSIRDNLI
jgi:hypothetical protein